MMNNSLTKYYQKKKKKTEKGYKKKARKRYQNLSEEAKEKHPAIWSRTIWSYSFPNFILICNCKRKFVYSESIYNDFF